MSDENQRYHTACGFSPKIEAYYTMMGPQNADQIPEGVKLVLDIPGVTQVAVLFDHGQGPRIEVITKLKKE